MLNNGRASLNLGLIHQITIQKGINFWSRIHLRYEANLKKCQKIKYPTFRTVSKRKNPNGLFFYSFELKGDIEHFETKLSRQDFLNGRFELNVKRSHFEEKEIRGTEHLDTVQVASGGVIDRLLNLHWE